MPIQERKLANGELTPSGYRNKKTAHNHLKTFLDGVDMRNIKDRQLWRKMAYVPQKSTSVPYSVLDMVLIGRNPYKSLFAQPDSNDRKMAEAYSP